MGHVREMARLRYSEAGSEIAMKMTTAVNANETRRLRRAKFMEGRSSKYRWHVLVRTLSKIGATRPLLNQRNLQVSLGVD
jgi:hypothetical protein